MNYIERTLEKVLAHEFLFKAVLVGARQVGKTTMLKHLAEGQSRTYVSMDNPMARTLAQTDPVLFSKLTSRPLSSTRYRAPQLFEQIKIICDESGEKVSFG